MDTTDNHYDEEGLLHEQKLDALIGLLRVALLDPSGTEGSAVFGVANGLFDVAAAIREHTQYLRSVDEAYNDG